MEKAQGAPKGGEYLALEIQPSQIYSPEEFDDELRMIAQTTREFVVNEVIPVLDRLEKLEPGLSEQLMRTAGELGLLALEAPEKYGGSDLPKLAAVLVAEYLAGASGFNTTISAHVTIGTLPLVYFGTEEQKARYLPKLISAEFIGAYALTEPQAGSDALGGTASAVLSDDGKHYILNGTKMWISNAGFADLFTVFAKIDGERKKFSAFLVEKTFEGLSTGAEEKKMGIKSSSTRQVILDNVKVPVENLLGQVGQGAKIAFNILNIGRFKLGSSCVGGSKLTLEIASKYAQEREQFGVPIASFGLIQEKLAKMACRTYAIESAVYRTVAHIDEAIGDNKDPMHQLQCIEEYAVECSMIKVLGSELLDYAVDEGVQIHGGYGYSQDYEIETYYRDSRVNRIYEGTSEINRLIIPGMLVKRCLKGHLPLLTAAAKVERALKDHAASEGEPPGEVAQVVENTKKLALVLLKWSLEAFGNDLEKEQEVLGSTADVIMAVYTMESTLLRTQKHAGDEKGQSLRQAMLQAYTAETLGRVQQWATQAVCRIDKTADRQSKLQLVHHLTRYAPIDVIGLQRSIAGAVLKASGYPISI